MTSINESRAIKSIGNGGSKVDEIDIINANGTKISKLAKSKDLT